MTGRSLTKIGNRNHFMASSHVGHDCAVGNGNTFVNQVSLAGHVDVGDSVIISGYVGVTQFVRIGSFAMIGAGCVVSLDVAPFVRGKAKKDQRFQPLSINRIGLERAGVTADEIDAIDESFRAIFTRGNTLKESIASLRPRFSKYPKVEEFLTFLEKSQHGIAR